MKTRWFAHVAVPFLALFLLVGLAFPSAAVALTPISALQPGNEMEARAVAQRSKANPGDQFAIAVVLDYSEGWHSWPNFKPELPKDLADLTIVPTEILPVAKSPFPKGVLVYPTMTQWPKPHLAKVTGAEILAFSDRTVAFVPVMIEPGTAPGKYTIKLAVSFQACDANSCVAPNVLDVSADIEVVAVGQAVALNEPNLFVGFDQGVFQKLASGDVVTEQWEFDFFGYKFKLRKDAYVPILLIAFLAGVIMNFTPCVLPVLPIKILSLQSHAKSPGKLLYLGAIYCLGVVLLYFVIGVFAFGLVTGGQRMDWGQWFSNPWFTGTMALIVATLGVAMTGGVAIRLPNFVYMVNPTGDSALGNLLGGLLTGVLATPCTGPLLGAAFAWAVTQPATMGLLAITMLGVGMASPYAILILFPKLIDKLPRGGPGSELLKQVMGILMVAVAAYLAGNLFEDKWPWWVVGGIGMAASVWLAIGAWRLLRTQQGKIACTVIGLGGVVGFYFMAASLANEGPLPWNRFHNKPDEALKAAIAEARAKGHVAVVDFTAKWCVNCQLIEKTILNSEAGVTLLTGEKVSLIRVDLTSADAAKGQGWGVVREVSGGGGIPLIAVFGPGIEKPIYFQSFFPIGSLEEAVRRARGG